MSALDLFASALGAFILLTIMLFPSYLDDIKNKEKIIELETELEEIKKRIKNNTVQLDSKVALLKNCEASLSSVAECTKQQENLKVKLKNCQQQHQSCLTQLGHTFLIVVLKWQTQEQDIDLYVIDNKGRKFYYKRHNRNQAHYLGSLAELSVDTKVGPGIEIWETPSAEPGIYKIYADLYDRVGLPDNPVVSTSLYYRDGFKKLPQRTLSAEETLVLIAKIQVKKNGKIIIH